MNILVLGGGGREHALVWQLAKSPQIGDLYCAPGNPGIAAHATCVDVDPLDFDAVVRFVREKRIDLTIPGPEAPLVAGIVDRFEAEELVIFGPTRAAAALEGSKAFAKYIMDKNNVPTAKWVQFTSFDEAVDYLEVCAFPCVVKADGLAAGKGAVIAATKAEARAIIREMLLEKRFGSAGERVVIEEFMRGEEASVFALSDGEGFVTLPPAQDHKAVFDGDQGPNTGGMGAYAPAAVVSPELLKRVGDDIIAPVLAGMAAEGTPYRGVLYVGLMLTEDGPKVVEFNCRFGDPEAQVVLPMIAPDLAALLRSCAIRELPPGDVAFRNGFAVTVVLASGGYPGPYEKGKPIHGLPLQGSEEETMVFHAGTSGDGNGGFCTAGGRVIAATGFSETFSAARDRAYAAADAIQFEGRHFRTDIGSRELARSG